MVWWADQIVDCSSRRDGTTESSQFANRWHEQAGPRGEVVFDLHAGWEVAFDARDSFHSSTFHGRS